MSAQKTPVQIKLTTEIKELDHKQTTKVEESGSFFQKGNLSVLTFTEHQEEDQAINALITIQANKVSIKRTGAVKMQQVFRKKQTTENFYHHAYGAIHMETRTDQLKFQRPENGKQGELFISYQVSLNGEQARRHRLRLIFKEEVLS